MGPCAIWLRGGVARPRPIARPPFLSSSLRSFSRTTGASRRPSGRFAVKITIGSSAALIGLAAHLIVLGSKVSSEFPGQRGFSFVEVDLDPLSASGL